MGLTEIWFGDDSTFMSTSNMKVKTDVHDGGFYALDYLIEG